MINFLLETLGFSIKKLNIVLLIVFTILFISCGKSPEEKIVSKWKSFDKGYDIEFTKVGIVILNNPQTQQITGTYKFIDKDRIIMKLDNQEETSVWNVKFVNKNLLLKNETTQFIRKFLSLENIKFDKIYDFVDGIARFKFNNKFGFIDTSGVEIVEVKFKNAEDYSNGLALVQDENGYNIINSTGNIIHHIEGNNLVSCTFSYPQKEDVMKFLYGNFSYGTSTWRPQKEVHPQKIFDEGMGNGDILFTKVIFDTLITYDSKQRYLIITSTNTSNNQCHACAPFIGTFIFSKYGDKWYGELNYCLDFMGSYGEPPEVKYINTGQNALVLKFSSGYMAQGYVTGGDDLYSLYKMKFVNSLSITTEDSSSADGEEEQTKYKFVKGTNSDHNDVVVNTVETSYDSQHNKITKKNEEKLVYKDGKYVK